MRLIDADALEDMLMKAIALQDIGAKIFGIEKDVEVWAEIKAYRDILGGVKEQPTIDRPEIVHCRDCEMNNQCSVQFKFADADDPGGWFCAYGKRAKDGERGCQT